MDYWEMQVRELFCDKCKSWLVTRSDLVSHHTSTHKVGRQYQQRLGYWLRICHGILFTLNISVIIAREVMITINKLDSHQSSTHGIVNYSFVSMGENPTVRLFFLSFIFTFCWYFLSKLITVSRNKRWDRHLVCTFEIILCKKIWKYFLILFITQALSHHRLLGQWDCESVR